MKTLTVLAFVLLCASLGHAETVDYSLSVVNAPGGIGDFSWTIETQGFIQPVPLPVYDPNGNCLNCDTNFFDSFLSVSAPSNGGGCGISRLFLAPDQGLITFFSPLCDGLYDSTVAGGLPDAGVVGTWTWQGTNPDDTQNFVTLTISDPPASPAAAPEPSTLALALCGCVFLPLARRRLA